MATLGLNALRTAFRMGEHVAPSLAGRAAFELFCRTPNPRKPSAREQRVLGQGARFMAEARHHRLETSGRGAVMVHDFIPADGVVSRGVVLVVHGWRSRTDHMRSLIKALREDGYRVIGLDLPGHGASTGRRLNLVNAVEALNLAATWFGPFAAVIGHSFGGAAALNAVAGSIPWFEPVAARRLVLIAAPSSMPAIFEDFGAFLQLGPRAQTAIARQVERLSGRVLDDFVGADQLAGLSVPTLVIHAPDDKEVAFDSATAFRQAGDHVTLHVARGLGHRRIVADPEVAQATLGFLRQPVHEPVRH